MPGSLQLECEKKARSPFFMARRLLRAADGSCLSATLGVTSHIYLFQSIACPQPLTNVVPNPCKKSSQLFFLFDRTYGRDWNCNSPSQGSGSVLAARSSMEKDTSTPCSSRVSGSALNSQYCRLSPPLSPPSTPEALALSCLAGFSSAGIRFPLRLPGAGVGAAGASSPSPSSSCVLFLTGFVLPLLFGATLALMGGDGGAAAGAVDVRWRVERRGGGGGGGASDEAASSASLCVDLRLGILASDGTAWCWAVMDNWMVRWNRRSIIAGVECNCAYFAPGVVAPQEQQPSRGPGFGLGDIYLFMDHFRLWPRNTSFVCGLHCVELY